MKKICAVSLLTLALVACGKTEQAPVAEVASAPAVTASVAAAPAPAHAEPVATAAEPEAAAAEPEVVAAPSVPVDSAKPEAIYQAGVHYRVLDTPVPTVDASRIEVVEVFSYHCGHCFNFESLLKPWKAQQAADVNVVQMHAIWNPGMEVLARGFSTGVALRISDKAHMAAFTRLHVERKPLNTADQWIDFYTTYGLERDVVEKTFNSLGVTNMVSQARARVANYKVTGTPELIIEGKYGVSAGMAKGQIEMLQVADYLVKLSRWERAQKQAAK